ncbi:hypothetical protein SADUNF_Sadunf06G0131100 [Salix dunnii]|uniref:Oberon PHD finger domain-containing protein n=1 Tax=Salix dunnii TaxID=1413687 RepID=A0A835K739_9ROSI|nr:hypothetical protein SADUNF_Sadunf06G0131100 [Salix dunnii]
MDIDDIFLAEVSGVQSLSSSVQSTLEKKMGDSCELSCHIECALQREKVGAVDLGQLMQLDGSYCCASCGKVSGILGSWKKHLIIAKDARRLDVLCYRLYLSYRLLDGTSRFKELHGIVKDAKAKIETEVGPVDGVSAKMARGIVSRLTLVTCRNFALLQLKRQMNGSLPFLVQTQIAEDSLPAACRFLFEEVKSSSVVIILIELSTAMSDDIKGYKLWYCKKAGDLGHSEAKCFTKSIEIIQKNHNPSVARNDKKENTVTGGYTSNYNRDPKTTTSQGCFEGFCSADTEKCCGGSEVVEPQISEDPLPSVSHGLDLNFVSVPDLNEDLTPFESSRDEDNECTLEQAIEADDDAASHDVEKNDLASSHGTGDSQTWMHGPRREVPPVDSRSELCRKRAAHTNEDLHDCDSTLIYESPFFVSSGSGYLDDNFEYCVKTIRWLECEGYINQEFRLKLLTWFSLRSMEQERRVVNTFIQTLIDDPSSLAGQLVDSFSDIISSKRRRNGFCGKLWH